MGRVKKKKLTARANLLKANKARLSRINNETKTESADDHIDLDSVMKFDVKEEPDIPPGVDNWHYSDDVVDGDEEKYHVAAEVSGDNTDYSDCQDNSVSGSMEAPIAPACSTSYDAAPTATVSTGQEKRCLLCYRECDPLDLPIENKENVFRTMFLMKKMLQVPNHMLEDYLVNFGSPNSWISLCSMCKTTVDKALAIQKQINQLETSLRTSQAGMVRVIKQSVARLPETSLPYKRRVRNVTDETRIFVSTTGKYSCKESNTKTTEPKKVRKSMPFTQIEFIVTSTSGVSFGSNDKRRKSRKQNLSDLKLTVPEYLDDSTTFSQIPSTLSTRSESSSRNRQFSIADQIEAMRKKVQDVKNSVKPLLEPKFKVSPRPPQPPQSILNDPVIFNKTIYTCNLCPHLEKMSFHSFAIHILFHHRRPYRCSSCNTYYASLKELDHSQLNDKRLKEDASAHVCTQDTLVKTKFPPEKIWSCEQCSELFDLESQRDEHVKEDHSSESKNSSELKHYCKTCGKKSRNLKDWILHRAIQHPEVALLSCYFCDENFGLKTKEGIDVNMCSPRTLNDHLRKRHIKRNKKTTLALVTCDFCGQSFMRSNDLQEHVSTSHGLNSNKAFSCSICCCRMTSFSTLKKHMEMKHKAGTQERYVCESCGYSVSNRSCFEVHSLQQHGIRPERGGVRTCEVEGCTFEYLYKQHFDKHMMLVHNAARKHTCQYCGKGFLNANNRREHEQIHLNKTVKPFKCKICGNSFALRNYLYIHMRLSHLNRPFASTNKKRPSRKRLSQRPSTSNFGLRLTESNASANSSSGQDPLIVSGPDQNIDRDGSQYGEISSALNVQF